MANTLLANSVGGLAAGALSTIAMHPLDLTKTRMQISGGNTLKILADLHKEHGPRGLYRGLGTNLIGGMLGWGFYFAWYGQIKAWMSRGRTQLSGTEYLISSALAGILTSICTNPIWVVKTRMLTTNRGEQLAYDNFLDGLQKIARQEGLKGLYRGLLPSLFGVTHGALQFTLYEMLKNRRADRSPGTTATTADFLQLSAASKILATVMTYPYQVFRSRLQVHNVDPSVSVMSTARDVWSSQGMKGFYRGLTPNLLRVVPATCITMVVYEQVNRLVLGQ
ncbi:protein of unknown function [Taphrina deformans PYCC 5710]|uniref:Uncharacterized protein n=1 Tax=Taphrina deformans (strain PYCC 5710 / ATCC 11124 / CBS 356.35 / IMI 108563 / JCM 9778 / NBRC 8474) TaxID=1097556 RepID=R4XNT9_TAPDE|nr:protein of unknown function [Taphrina deformans PYCC 5710]|eukprot:CCG84930.1 protein of unknown function [Taphrina deformans PYCC 5710]